ncbi:MAG: hypothetical protein LBE20_02805 [Deltaproteobacteria bacterium]|nr:hypothetical protein [Deltaproteobacteria bacterium]
MVNKIIYLTFVLFFYCACVRVKDDYINNNLVYHNVTLKAAVERIEEYKLATQKELEEIKLLSSQVKEDLK